MSPGDHHPCPLTLPFALLDKAARVQAVRVPTPLRADAYQAAWVRFCQRDPLTSTGAHLMARHAAIDVVRDDRRHWHNRLVDVPAEEPQDNEMFEELAQAYPLQVAWLLTYATVAHPSGAQKTKAHRLRKRLKEAWHETLNRRRAGPGGAGAGDAGRYC